MQISVAQPNQQWRGVQRVFPWLDDKQTQRLYNKVDQMGITDPSKRLEAEQEVYNKTLPYIKQKKIELERANAKNELYNKALDEKEPFKQKQQINQVRMADMVDLIKKKEWLRAEAPDNEIFNIFMQTNPNKKELVDKYFETWDKDTFFEMGLKGKNAWDRVKDIVWWVAESASWLGEVIWKWLANATARTAKKLGADEEKTNALRDSYKAERDTLGGETVGDENSKLYKWARTTADIVWAADIALVWANTARTAIKAHKAAKASKILDNAKTWEDIFKSKTLTKFWDYIQPKASAQARKGVDTFNKVIPETTFSNAKVVPNKSQLQMIKDSRGIVDHKLPPNENILRIDKAIAEEAKKLDSMVGGNKSIVSPKELETRFAKIEKSPEIVWDAEKTFEKVQNKFFSLLKKNKGTPSWLRKTKQEFSLYLKERTNAYKKGSPLYKTVRSLEKEVDDIIAERLGTSWDVYKASLRKQSNLKRIQDNLKTKRDWASTVGKFVRKHQWALRNVWYSVGGWVVGWVVIDKIRN